MSNRKEEILKDLREQLKLNFITTQEFIKASEELNANFSEYDENTGMSIEEAADMLLDVVQ